MPSETVQRSKINHEKQFNDPKLIIKKRFNGSTTTIKIYFSKKINLLIKHHTMLDQIGDVGRVLVSRY